MGRRRRSDYENYGFDELIDDGERYDRMEELIGHCQDKGTPSVSRSRAARQRLSEHTMMA